RPEVRQDPEERHAKSLSGLPARHVSNSCRHDQCRFTCIPQVLKGTVNPYKASELHSHPSRFAIDGGSTQANTNPSLCDSLLRLVLRCKLACAILQRTRIHPPSEVKRNRHAGIS